MAVDARLQVLRTAVTELIAFESDLAARLEGEQEVLRPYPEALAVIEGFRPTVHAQRDRLVSYLEGIGGAEAEAATQGGLPFCPATGFRRRCAASALPSITVRSATRCCTRRRYVCTSPLSGRSRRSTWRSASMRRRRSTVSCPPL